jgi:uncharacterized membrane protein
MTNNTETKANLESKRAQFTRQQPKRNPVKILALVVLIAGVAIAGYFALKGFGDNQSASPIKQRSDAVTVALAELDSGKAKFFDYTTSSNTPVRFFAVKSTDGKYRAAMDACDTCFHAKKGYRQEGDSMICNNCGMKFHSNLINQVSGGCNPIGVTCSVEDGQLVIKTSELESRKNYFQ